MLNFQIIYTDSKNSDTFEENLPHGIDCWEILLTLTPALFYVDGHWKKFPKDQVVIYPPGHPIHYKALDGPYIDHWIRFYTDESYVTDSGLPLATPIAAKDPVYIDQLIRLLGLEHYHGDVYHARYSHESEDHLLRVLYNKIHESIDTEPEYPQTNKLLNLRSQICSNPGGDWTIETMAEKTHMSTGHLQRLYKEQFHISCMNDVIQQRIKLATEHLTRSSIPIADIAVSCGYHNTEHFCRQFRKHMGCSPGEYRKTHGKQNM